MASAMLPIDELLVSASPGETRLALIAGGQVVEFVIDRGDAAAGDVIAGRVVGIASGTGAAFVEIGEALPGFLPRAGKLSEGASILVEVAAAARRGKGAELARAAADAEPVRRPPLARVRATHGDIASVLVDDIASLAETRRLFPSARRERDAFQRCDAGDILEQALLPRVPLAGGGALIIEEAAAATLIDVDGGRNGPLEANLAAVAEIARQIRLRGLAGHILADVIPMRDRRAPQRIVEALRAALANDPTPAHIIGRTPLGMIEMTRRRRGPSLAEVMLEVPPRRPDALTIGLAGLRALMREYDARPAASLALALPPRAVTALRGRPSVVEETERRLGRPLALIERPGVEAFMIEEKGN